MEHRLSALLQLHLHSQLNTWLQWIGLTPLQEETRNIYVLGFGATYTRGFTVLVLLELKETHHVGVAGEEAHNPIGHHAGHLHQQVTIVTDHRCGNKDIDRP